MTTKKPRRLIVGQPFPHSQKDSSSIEEKMFSKVTLPSTLIFPAKDVCTINLTVSCYLYLYSKPCEKCFFMMDGSEAEGDLVLIQTLLLYYVNQVILMLTSTF